MMALKCVAKDGCIHLLHVVAILWVEKQPQVMEDVEKVWPVCRG
jgi:N-glycosylase/DNA lyase